MARTSVPALAACLLAIGTFGACGGDNGEASPTSTASASAVGPTATPLATATPTVSVSATEASTQIPMVRLYPIGTRSGIPTVDGFVNSMEDSDAGALLALLEYSPVPCADPADQYFPVCPAGFPAGTAVDAVRQGRCDVGWLPRELEIIPDLQRFVRGDFGIFAIARLPAPARSIPQRGPPAGEYLIVMDDVHGPSGEPRAAIARDGGVVQLSTGCFSVSARQLLEHLYTAYSGPGTTPSYLMAPL